MSRAPISAGLVLATAVACGSTPPTTTQPAPATPATGAVSTPAATPTAVADQKFAADPGLAFTDPERREKLEAAFPAIDKAMADELARQGLPGIAVGIVIDGELAYAKGFGTTELGKELTPDADTVYRIGSITKSFTGLALLAQRDAGALDLDDPLTKWIPEASGLVYPSRDARPITLRQLATHTSGLPRDGAFDPKGPTEAVVVASLGDLPLENAPGMVNSYSNLGFALLGLAAAHAAKRPYHDLVADTVLRPLGMTSTYWSAKDVPAGKLAQTYEMGPDGAPRPVEPIDLGAADAAGGIYASVRDMAKYAAFQLAAYPPRDEADTGPLRRATVREAHLTGVAAGGEVRLARSPAKGEPTVELSATTYGFGWVHEQTCKFDDLIWHNGAIDSHRAALQFLTGRGVAVIALSNHGNAQPLAYTGRILDELAKTGALEKRVARPTDAFDAAMTAFLDVMNNTWNEQAYVAMLDPARGPNPVEEKEITGYHALHGKCTGFKASQVRSANDATFDVTCERGTLSMLMVLSPRTKLITGFVGTSRGVDAPPALLAKGKQIAKLIGKWDDKVHEQVLGKAKPGKAEMKAAFASLRASHGSCKVAAAVHEGFDWHFELACDRGGDLGLGIVLDKDDVAGIGLFPLATGCPVL